MKDLHLFVPQFRVDECLSELRQCLEKGWTGLGYKTLEIEKRWCEYTDLPYAHFLNSATSGLHLAIALFKRRFGWEDGDEVITTPLTFVSTNHVILYEGLRPVFADIDRYMCLDPESVADRITERTRAVMFVGLGGSVGHLEAISALCRERDLKLILDAAHMAGTRLHGKHVGAEADATVFSFQAVKNLPTADSGMICFADQALDQEVRKWTWLGIDKDTFTRTLDSSTRYKWYYNVENIGYKYHGSSIMAALALVSLKYLDQDNSYRREIAAWYDREFERDGTVERVPVPDGCESSRHLYQILVDCRDETIAYLNDHRIFPGVHYRDNTIYPMYSEGRGSCPRASSASDRVISLPMHLSLDEQDVVRIAACIRTRPLRTRRPREASPRAVGG